MLPKKSKVGTKEVERIFKEGRFVGSSNLTFKYKLKGGATAPKISFIVPKSVAKLAIQRNLLRRRGYSALKNSLILFPASLIGVFIFKKYQDDVSILENEIKNVLNKIN